MRNKKISANLENLANMSWKRILINMEITKKLENHKMGFLYGMKWDWHAKISKRIK